MRVLCAQADLFNELKSLKIAVRFADGETIVGMSNRFPPLGNNFFMLPIDPKSNNQRIPENRGATVAITEAPATAALT